MHFSHVANLSEFIESKKKLVVVNEQRILLVYLHGTVYAVHAVCPHSGGPLEEGEIDDQEIVCPWHKFMFNIKTGVCLNYPSCSIRKYKVKVDGDKVFVGFEF